MDPQLLEEQALHVKPSVVPLHEPDWYCEDEHCMLLHEVQAPFALADAPFRNCPLGQVGWSLQVKPSVVPLHEPD